jgi:hypothetical protein
MLLDCDIQGSSSAVKERIVYQVCSIRGRLRRLKSC